MWLCTSFLQTSLSHKLTWAYYNRASVLCLSGKCSDNFLMQRSEHLRFLAVCGRRVLSVCRDQNISTFLSRALAFICGAVISIRNLTTLLYFFNPTVLKLCLWCTFSQTSHSATGPVYYAYQESDQECTSDTLFIMQRSKHQRFLEHALAVCVRKDFFGICGKVISIQNLTTLPYFFNFISS